MNDKLGRNDPCFCGSGQKYKKCCMTTLLPSFAFSEVTDFEWRKIRQLEGAVIDKHLGPYVMQTLPDDVMRLAISDSLPENLPEEIDEEVLFHQFLMPWIFFNWIPAEDFGLKQFNPDITIAENYLIYHKTKLNYDERRFIEAMLTTFYSFYAVLEVEKDQSLLLKDILLDTEHRVKERQGTRFLSRGDIIFGRILTFNNQSIFVGMAPFTLPPQYHIALLDFKKWLIKENDNNVLDQDVLKNELDLDLYHYFFDALNEAYNKPLPTLVNTDGDLFQPATSHFKLTQSPEDTLSCLMSMTLSDDPKEFLQDAKRTKAGKVTEIQLPWLKKGNKKHKQWENTLLGEIIIKKDKLILKTNSVKRAEKGRKLLVKLLGKNIEFQKMILESMQQKTNSLSKEDKDQDNVNERALMNTPEIREQMKAIAKAHWENWFDQVIPVLGNKTPRESAKTKEGRERLEALLLQYERVDFKREKDDPFRADIRFIKATLNLEKE